MFVPAIISSLAIAQAKLLDLNIHLKVFLQKGELVDDIT